MAEIDVSELLKRLLPVQILLGTGIVLSLENVISFWFEQLVPAEYSWLTWLLFALFLLILQAYFETTDEDFELKDYEED